MAFCGNILACIALFIHTHQSYKLRHENIYSALLFAYTKKDRCKTITFIVWLKRRHRKKEKEKKHITIDSRTKKNVINTARKRTMPKNGLSNM